MLIININVSKSFSFHAAIYAIDFALWLTILRRLFTPVRCMLTVASAGYLITYPCITKPIILNE